MRPKGSAAELEARRCRAVAFLADGKSLTEVARLVGADVSSVKRWRRAWQAGGDAALESKPIPGRPAELTEAERRRLAAIVRAVPLAASFMTDWWTCKRVAEVIRREFDVTYHPDHVGRLLHALGFTQQKPQRRASQRNEAAIARWRTHDWPRIKKRPGVAARPSCFSMKRASFSNP